LDEERLFLKSHILGADLIEHDGSALPSEVAAVLPASGKYEVIVAEQPALLHGKRYRVRYCIAVESTGGLVDLRRTRWVD
jgi:hypothetical protein